MTEIEIGGASPLFVVRNVPTALAFYRDKLGFEVTFEGPPDDIFFGIVQRGRAMLMFKHIGVEPVPNHKRDVGKGDARWDAYIYVPDPDALAAEFLSRDVEFFEPLKDNHDDLRGFEIKDADGYVLFFGRPSVVGVHSNIAFEYFTFGRHRWSGPDRSKYEYSSRYPNYYGH